MSKKVYTADVANAAVRNILSEISSKMFDPVTPSYLEEAAAFFEYKCPYTGKNIEDEIKAANGKSKNDLHMDHIIPENRFFLGLNVKGNTVYVCKEANAIKSKYDKEELSYEKVIDELCKDPVLRKERKDKIKAFQEKYGFDKILNACDDIKYDIQKFYEETQKRQIDFIKNVIKTLNKKELKVSKEIKEFCDYLKAKGRTQKVIEDYRYVLIRIIVENLNSIKELGNKKKILELLSLYSEGGEKYNPKDHKSKSVLNAYAEFKQVNLYSKKTKNKNEENFKKFLAKQKSKKTGKKISPSTVNGYVTAVKRALKEYGYTFDNILSVTEIEMMITDYTNIKKSEDLSGTIKAGLEYYKIFM